MLRQIFDKEKACYFSHNQSTPLHEVFAVNHIGYLKYFFEKGADVNAKNKCCFSNYQESPLHEIIVKNHLEIVKYLIGRGAIVNAQNEI